MKNRLKVSMLLVTLLSFTQQGISEQQIDESKIKELKVEKDSTKIGEDAKNEVQDKKRSLRVEYSNDIANSSANMNIGKVEFYVK